MDLVSPATTFVILQPFEPVLLLIAVAVFQVVPDESANPHLSLLRKKVQAGDDRHSRDLTREATEEDTEEPMHTSEEVLQVFSDDAECGVRDEFFHTQADHLKVSIHLCTTTLDAQVTVYCEGRCASPHQKRIHAIALLWHSCATLSAVVVPHPLG